MNASADKRTSLIFAALMIVVPLTTATMTRLGWLDAHDLGARLVMAITGAFLIVTGNTIPKRLAPLARLGSDPARQQSFRRFAGWAWVLTGLALGISWLALPIAAAITSTFVIIPLGIGLIAFRCAAERARS